VLPLGNTDIRNGEIASEHGLFDGVAIVHTVATVHSGFALHKTTPVPAPTRSNPPVHRR
jgi:hypothetical protein